MSKRHEVQAHLQSLTDMRGILNAMKNLALMEIHKLSRFLSAQRQAVAGTQKVGADFFAFHPALLPRERLDSRVYVAVGSERGFCGDFNEGVVTALKEALRAHPCSARVIGIGRKLAEKLGTLGDCVVGQLAGPSVAEEVPSTLIRLMNTLRDLQAKEDAQQPLDLTIIAHTQEDNQASVRSLEPFRQFGREPVSYGSPPLLYLDPVTFLTGLMHEYLFAYLHEIFYGSLMAESRRRFEHMEQALQRLDTQTDELSLKRQILRQEEITQEIAVILLGVEAMGGHR